MESVDKDNIRSWAIAAVIMQVVTAFTVAARILGVDPFTPIFDLFIVYLPTAILVNSIIFEWVQHSVKTNGSNTLANSAPVNTAV